MNTYIKGAACEKCGERGASSDFIPAEIEFEEEAEAEAEHIERVCQNCGYIWKEEPLDEVNIPKEDNE